MVITQPSHLNTWIFILVFRCHLNTQPFTNQTTFDHLNTRLIQYSGGYCIRIPTLINCQFCSQNSSKGREHQLGRGVLDVLRLHRRLPGQGQMRMLAAYHQSNCRFESRYNIQVNPVKLKPWKNGTIRVLDTQILLVQFLDCIQNCSMWQPGVPRSKYWTSQ